MPEQPIIDQYQTVAQPSQGLFKDRGSKFIAYAEAVYDEDEAKAMLERVRKLHPKGRHHCFAYRLGVEGLRHRANDDGEPSGTAGRPILGQIDSHELTNVQVVVVRYFGGTKLGVPGLIHAYKQATIEALAEAEVVQRWIMAEYELAFGYEWMSEVMGFLKQNEEVEIREQVFELTPRLVIAVRAGEATTLLAQLEAAVNPYGQLPQSPVVVKHLRTI